MLMVFIINYGVVNRPKGIRRVQILDGVLYDVVLISKIFKRDQLRIVLIDVTNLGSMEVRVMMH